MATVGLSFGSASSGAGFDVSSTVTQILALESGIEAPWKTQLTSLQAQDAAFSSLGSHLASLSTSLGSLTGFDGLFASKEGSSSDTSVLTLSAASTSAVAGSHTVAVSSLASTSSKYSDSIANAGDTLRGSLTVQIGSGSSQTITLGGSSNTLASLASTINSGNYGVTASVVTDTNGSRLSLVSDNSGSAGQISLSSSLSDSTTGTSVSFSTGQNGADAQLTVDGLATTSASNTVTGAIPGVTFQLLSASPGTSVQVQITNDNSSIETAVQGLVTAYNAVVGTIKTQEGKDSTGNAEPLFGDPTLALVQSQLASGLLAGKASGTISNIAQLGLSVNEDGTLALDVSTLDSTLNAHFNDVAGYFENSGSFGQTLTTTLNGLSSTGTTGAIYLALAQNSTTETGINTSISNEDARLATEKTNLTTELNTANQILQSIPSQLNEVNEIYSALTGYNSGNN